MILETVVSAVLLISAIGVAVINVLWLVEMRRHRARKKKEAQP